MPYIGKTPTVGNFQVCDAISVVNGQAAYTLQVGGANVAPESANHMLVSLNGILQKPGSSFTISGSTMTFASNLATGDVIDFVQILGNVLDLGQPSDDTVKTASLQANAVTGAKLNTDVISAQTALGAEPADTDEFLVSDAGVLKRVDYSYIKGGGITNAQQWRISANQTNMDNGDHITNNWEQADTYGYGGIGTAMSQSSGIFTFPTTGIWLITHNVTFQDATEQNHMSCIITATTDNSSYNSVAISMTHLKLINSSTTNTHASAQHIFDVTNTTTHKIRFATGAENNGYDVNGTTAANYTSATFIRLGDT